MKTLELKIENRKYKTLESEQIAQYSSWYAIVSLILVGICMRLWMEKPVVLNSNESFIFAIYVVISFGFLTWMGSQSKRRALINKLPSTKIIKLCTFIKEMTDKSTESGNWHVTFDNFNNRAMIVLFGDKVSSLIPSHDYLSYMLSDKFITIKAVTDKGNKIENNPISIELSDKALKVLEIYQQSVKW
jgi:hypothetical protein